MPTAKKSLIYAMLLIEAWLLAGTGIKAGLM